MVNVDCTLSTEAFLSIFDLPGKTLFNNEVPSLATTNPAIAIGKDFWINVAKSPCTLFCLLLFSSEVLLSTVADFFCSAHGSGKSAVKLPRVLSGEIVTASGESNANSGDSLFNSQILEGVLALNKESLSGLLVLVLISDWIFPKKSLTAGTDSPVLAIFPIVLISCPIAPTNWPPTLFAFSNADRREFITSISLNCCWIFCSWVINSEGIASIILFFAAPASSLPWLINSEGIAFIALFFLSLIKSLPWLILFPIKSLPWLILFPIKSLPWLIAVSSESFCKFGLDWAWL